MADPASAKSGQGAVAAVTVAIPCLNAARWVAQAVGSALGQEGADVRVIVADNGSTDGTLDRLRGFGGRIELLAVEKKGANAARNAALAAADTPWVQFLDADDYLLPGKLAAQLAAAAGDEAAVYGPVWMEDLGRGTREIMPVDPSLDLCGQWISWQLPQTGGMLWRREALERLGGWNEAMPCCQEHELYLRALRAGCRFRFSPEPLAVYRVWSEETLCRKDPARTIRVRTGLIEELIGWMRGRGMFSERHRELVGRAFFEMARTLAREDLAAAARYHREKARAGLISATGPAAPPRYRLAYRLLGFRAAERIARLTRRRAPGRETP